MIRTHLLIRTVISIGWLLFIPISLLSAQPQTERENFLHDALIPFWTDQNLANFGRSVGLNLYENPHDPFPNRKTFLWDAAIGEDLLHGGLGLNRYSANGIAWGVAAQYLTYELDGTDFQRQDVSLLANKQLFFWGNFSQESNRTASIHLGLRPRLTRIDYESEDYYLTTDAALLFDLARRGIKTDDPQGMIELLPGQTVPIRRRDFIVTGGLFIDNLFHESTQMTEAGFFASVAISNKYLVAGQLSADRVCLGLTIQANSRWLKALHLALHLDFQGESSKAGINFGIQQNLSKRTRLYHSATLGETNILYRQTGAVSFGNRKPPRLERGFIARPNMTVYLVSELKTTTFPLSMDLKNPFTFLPQSALQGRIELHDRPLKDHENIFVELTGPDQNGILLRAKKVNNQSFTFSDTTLASLLNILSDRYQPGQWRVDVFAGPTPEISVRISRSHFRVPKPAAQVCLKLALQYEALRQRIETGQDKVNTVTDADLMTEYALYKKAIDLAPDKFEPHYQLAKFLWWEIVSQKRLLEFEGEMCKHLQIAQGLAREDEEKMMIERLMKLCDCQ